MTQHSHLRRAMALALALIICIGFIPAGSPAASAAAPTLGRGDYIVMGRYENADILWRMIRSDQNGALMLSHNVITVKPFNSKGIKPANVSVPDGINMPQEPDSGGIRAANGSNLWINSTLRAWLNSDEQNVTYIGNPPSAGNVEGNAYDTEPGFLTNFTAAERAAMLPTKQKALLGNIDADIRDGGIHPPSYGDPTYDENAFFQMVTDTMFLPDTATIEPLQHGDLTQPVSPWWSTGYSWGFLTPQAISQAEGEITQSEFYGSNGTLAYWLRGSAASAGNSDKTRAATGTTGFNQQIVSRADLGVRPAFYLDQSKITITGGSGTLDDPYTLTAFGVTLKGDNTTKLYGDTDRLTVTASTADDLTLKYIMVDPDSTATVTTEAGFNALGAATTLPPNGATATITVDKNCTVWVMAKSGDNVAFASKTYKNFFERVMLYQVGKSADGEYLYHATLIPGMYGVPINTYKSNALLNGAVYDTVSVLDEATALGALEPYWNRKFDMPDNITLNDTDYLTNNTVNMTYQKNGDTWVTVNFYFVDDTSQEIQVEDVVSQPVKMENWVPKGMTLSDVGVTYDVPPAQDDDDLKPYKWVMYDISDTGFTGPALDSYEEIENGAYMGFDPRMPVDKSEVNIRIYYRTGQVFVTETCVDDDTDEVLRVNPISIKGGDDYKRDAAPAIDHYVVVAYQIEGEGREDLTVGGDGKPEWVSFSINDVTADTGVTFYYAADTNSDGIPDKSQMRLTVRWIGVYPDSKPDVVIREESNVVLRRAMTIFNDGDGTPGDGSGDPAHVIDDVINGGGAKWIFDNVNDSAGKVISNTADTVVRFYYNHDSTGAGLADIDQYVNIEYAVYDGSTLGPIVGPPPHTVPLVKGAEFNRNAPNINGYTRYGYKLDGGDLQPFTTNANVTFTATRPSGSGNHHTVTYVYRVAAAPITVKWVGVSLAGNEYTFSTRTYNGWVGDTLTVDDAMRASVDVDLTIWNEGDALLDGAAMTLPQDVSFTTSQQDIVFRYDEKVGAIVYNVRAESTDGKLDMSYQITRDYSAGPFEVKAGFIPGYAYVGYCIQEFGVVVDSGTDATLTFDPQDGSFDVIFRYTPAVADVTVKAVDGSGNLLNSQKFSGQTIGETFNATAPHVDGYALSASEPQLKTLIVDADSAQNVITFVYERLNTVYINCIEQLPDGREVVLRSIPITQTGSVMPPDLLRDYFIFDPANPNNDTTPTVVTNSDFVTGRIIRYYYKSMTMDVYIMPFDSDGNVITSGIVHILNGARLGEMYTATAPAIDNYVLDDAPTKDVYAHPSLPELHVEFYYHLRAAGDVTVRHCYMDGGTKVVLKEYTVAAPVGLPFTAYAETFEGFTLNDLDSKNIAEVGDAATDEIEFLYTDARKTLKVEVWKDGAHTDTALDYTVKLPQGSSYTIIPPYISEHSMASYQIDENPVVTTGLAAINLTVNDDTTTVKLNYVSFVNLTIVGVNTANHSEVLYSYVKRVQKNTDTTLQKGSDVFYLPGWTLDGGQDGKLSVNIAVDTELKFEYTKEITHTDITISAKAGGVPIPGFTPIVVSAAIGQKFSYNAPYISGYVLVDDVTKIIDGVAAGSADTITFNYDKAVGNITVLLKEDDTNGRVIKTLVQNAIFGEEVTITPPALTSYTVLSANTTVTFQGVPIFVELYYKKDTLPVYKVTKMDGGDEIGRYSMGNYRVGEVAEFHAPSGANYSDVKVLGDLSKLVLIEAPSPTMLGTIVPFAAGDVEVVFTYVSIGVDTLVVELLDENGDVLHTYDMASTNGTTIAVTAPPMEGYKLKSGEPQVKNGTVPGKVTFSYVPLGRTATLDVTVKLAQNGAVQAGATVTVTHGSTTTTYTTDTNGNVHIDDLPYGRYTVTASYSGYHSGTSTFELVGDRAIEFALGRTDTTVIGGGGGLGGGTAETPEEKPDEKPDEAPAIDTEDLIHTAYINGYDDGTVRPDAPITRAEVAAVFYRLLDQNDSGTYEQVTRFTDIEGDEWYAEAVETLAALGILHGYDDGSFGGGNRITRAEFTAVVVRFARLGVSEGVVFSDTEQHWARGYVTTAFQMGWINGYGDGTFKPHAPITRAEAVKIVNLLLNRNAFRSDIPADYADYYSDLPDTHWAYPHIIEASITHTFERTADGHEAWLP